MIAKYFEYYHNINGLKCLLSQTHIERLFRNGNALIPVKAIHKFFSQKWDCRSGPTNVKNFLMGHSLKGDVDLVYYSCQSQEDLKKIYDKIIS